MTHDWRLNDWLDICRKCECRRYRLQDGRVGYYRRPSGDAVGDEPVCAGGRA